ncbi:MAG TPA: phosphonate ABC transporter, permease protein PhnE [Gemmataceae bacterium]|nr:phosphonate ABC transporter, permease protein PhnE [Gemmataceae bacterium]
MSRTEGPSYEDILIAERRQNRRAALRAGLAVVVIIGSCAYVGLLDTRRLTEGLPSIVQLLGEMFPPDFQTARSWLRPLLDTLAMSVAGTALAAALSLPLGLLAARNTTPHLAIYAVARGLLNILRTIPELILGILFVAAVGFGALPGVLALGLHSAGMVGKFLAEAIEHADPAPIEAARAAGASPLQVIVHGIFPQILSKMADLVVYRWEHNFRASTVMGAVGAGGIGFQLIASLRLMQYQEVSAILLVILATVTLVDALGASLRRRFK